MDSVEKALLALLAGLLLFLFTLIGVVAVFATLEESRKNRELDLRERELELRAQQYPYKTEASVEIKTP